MALKEDKKGRGYLSTFYVFIYVFFSWFIFTRVFIFFLFMWVVSVVVFLFYFCVLCFARLVWVI
ncbi:hypothetical protein E2C01_021161 [Portunus trituberculatus]|uniref:Uncharacterized protein n=1 Tax=Portunus trituberculatus TaxID=210409 RepID=A0A5B7E3G8_PORTR|nr:hypothetical protein [Portunus trituberculatus]